MKALKNIAVILLGFAVIFAFIAWFVGGNIWNLVQAVVYGLILFAFYRYVHWTGSRRPASGVHEKDV